MRERRGEVAGASPGPDCASAMVCPKRDGARGGEGHHQVHRLRDQREEVQLSTQSHSNHVALGNDLTSLKLSVFVSKMGFLMPPQKNCDAK